MQRKAERAFFHVNLQGMKGLKTFASNAIGFFNEFFTFLIWIHFGFIYQHDVRITSQ
jgi:hypothetical protein